MSLHCDKRTAIPDISDDNCAEVVVGHYSHGGVHLKQGEDFVYLSPHQLAVLRLMIKEA